MSSSSSSSSSSSFFSAAAAGAEASPEAATGAATAANFDGSFKYSLARDAASKSISVTNATEIKFFNPFTIECGTDAKYPLKFWSESTKLERNWSFPDLSQYFAPGSLRRKEPKHRHELELELCCPKFYLGYRPNPFQ
ncbi:hypothetical protein DERF_009492 [Dermatophagoides farinae]|uniref:Uncharacterized protein n=1 Tax=Dermatophagoides farinae TaxID=6954 RepID=A0A922HU57_DERFA|nr:hypothetical protein DERF_009492 [Dermatophagoides farinae]